MNNSDIVKSYELSGGSRVDVYKPFGTEIYAAVTQMSGQYPEDNAIAKNVGRDEFLAILDGEFQVTVNEESHTLVAGDTIFIPNGARYQISGTGRSLVVVKDAPGGETQILAQP